MTISVAISFSMSSSDAEMALLSCVFSKSTYLVIIAKIKAKVATYLVEFFLDSTERYFKYSWLNCDLIYN